jgi:hypothetical protein
VTVCSLWRDLSQVSKALATADLYGSAERLAVCAQTLAQSTGEASALADAASALAAAAQYDQAETLADSIQDPLKRKQALRGIAITLANAGQGDRAEAMTRSASGLSDQTALVSVATALASAGKANAPKPSPVRWIVHPSKQGRLRNRPVP